MSASLGLLAPFDPIAAEWSRRPAIRRAVAARPDTGAVGYRGGPLPGLPAAGPVPAPTQWGRSLMRWLAEMPRDMPPLG